jgi:anthranilate phosphoribosyltransferase
MDPTSLAAAMVGAQMSQMQMAAAAFMLRMNADSAASVVQVIDAAQQNMQSLANVAAGIGQNVNISV